jgi:hypothetical protein
MFSAASCGLVLLCDEALKPSSSDTDHTPSPPPKRKRTHNKRVSFRPKDDVVEFEGQPAEENDPVLPKDCESGTEDDVTFGATIEQRLYEAGFNSEINRGPFRYQKPIAALWYKRSHGTLSADRAQVYWGQSIQQAGANQSRETEGAAIGRKWWETVPFPGNYPRAHRRRYCDD